MAYENQAPHRSQSSEALAAMLATLPVWHGKPADRNRNARRRQRQKAKRASDEANKAEKATFEWEINLPGPPNIPLSHARNFTVFHVNIDPSQNQPESQSAAGSAPQDAQNRTENLNQARSGGQQTTAAPRRVDSFKIGDARSSPEASSQLHNKPALSASSTSAEIVEALMPDRPPPVHSPRRTASTCYCHQKKMAVRDEVMAWEAERKARGI